MLIFTKEERLSSLKQIKAVFDNGSSFLLYPYRVIYLNSPIQMPYPATLLVSVPKKKFGRAVDRNRIKRLIREAYRLNKEENLYPFIKESNANLLLVIQYIAPEILKFDQMSAKLKNVFLKLKQEHEKNSG